MSGTPRLPKTRSTRFIRTTRTKTRRNSKPSVKKKRPNLRRTRLRGHRGGGVKAYFNKHRKGGTLGFTKTDIPVADRPGYVVRISGDGVDDNAVIQQMNQWEVNSDGFVVPCPGLHCGKGPYFDIADGDRHIEKGLLTRNEECFLDLRYDKLPKPSIAEPVLVSMGDLKRLKYNLLNFDRGKNKCCSSTVFFCGKQPVPNTDIRVNLFGNNIIGFVLDPNKITIPYAEFFAYATGSIIPKEFTKNGVKLGNKPLRSKYSNKEGRIIHSRMGTAYAVNHAKWEHTGEYQGVYHSNGTLETFNKNVWRKSLLKKIQKKIHKIKTSCFTQLSTIHSLNEALVQQKGHENPLIGIIINVSYGNLNSLDIDELIAVFRQYKYLFLLIYDVRQTFGIARVIREYDHIWKFLKNLNTSDIPTDTIYKYPIYSAFDNTQMINRTDHRTDRSSALRTTLSEWITEINSTYNYEDKVKILHYIWGRDHIWGRDYSELITNKKKIDRFETLKSQNTTTGNHTKQIFNDIAREQLIELFKPDGTFRIAYEELTNALRLDTILTDSQYKKAKSIMNYFFELNDSYAKAAAKAEAERIKIKNALLIIAQQLSVYETFTDGQYVPTSADCSYFIGRSDNWYYVQNENEFMNSLDEPKLNLSICIQDSQLVKVFVGTRTQRQSLTDVTNISMLQNTLNLAISCGWLDVSCVHQLDIKISPDPYNTIPPSISTAAKTKKDLFDNVLDMYTFDILGDPQHTAFVKHIYSDGNTFQDMKVTLVSCCTDESLLTPEHKFDIIQYYSHRHPIHIGGWDNIEYCYDEITVSKMSDVLGYNKETAMSNVERYASNYKYRFGVLGWTPVNREVDVFLKNLNYWGTWKPNVEVKPPSDTSLSNDYPMGVWFLHTWGVNCESVRTPDYKFCMEKSTMAFQINKYEILLKKMFSIIKKAALHLRHTEHKTVVLRIPKLGLGVWATCIPHDLKDTITQLYEKQVQLLANELNKEKTLTVFVLFVDYKGQFQPNITYLYHTNAPRVVFETHADPFGTFDRRPNNTKIKIPQNSVYLIVNAWDEGSFIGNKCSRDNSMDGWTVAGSPYSDNSNFYLSDIPNMIFGGRQLRLGAQCENASFLHNAVFQKTLQQDFEVI